MNVLVMDDDVDFAEKLKDDLINNLSEIDEYIKIDTYTSNFSDIAFVKEYKILFIDIDLVEVNGIELAKKINVISPGNIIVFVSSLSHLVHNSLIVRPFFFVRKSNYDKDIEIFYELIKSQFIKEEIMVLNYKSFKTSVSINHISYIEAADHMLKVQCAKVLYYDNRSLKDMLLVLPIENFVRVHRSFIINVEFLVSYNGKTIRMVDGTSINIGRKYKELFNTFYQEYLIR